MVSDLLLVIWIVIKILIIIIHMRLSHTHVMENVVYGAG